MFRRPKTLTEKEMLANLKKAKEIYGSKVIAEIVRRMVAKEDPEAIVQFKNIMEKGKLRSLHK